MLKRDLRESFGDVLHGTANESLTRDRFTARCFSMGPFPCPQYLRGRALYRIFHGAANFRRRFVAYDRIGVQTFLRHSLLSRHLWKLSLTHARAPNGASKSCIHLRCLPIN